MAKEKEEKPLHELLPPVEFTPMGASSKQLDQGNLLAAKQTPAFPIAGGVISHCLTKRGERLLMDFTAQACGMKFEVDGVWMNVDPMDRARESSGCATCRSSRTGCTWSAPRMDVIAHKKLMPRRHR